MTFKELLKSIKTPEQLNRWMVSNIHYSNFTKLMSPEDVFDKKAGSCHDQVNFESKFFSKFGLTYGKLFFIEHNDVETANAMTHTLIYFIRNDKYYWFENAWEGLKGIHGPFETLKDLKNKITELHKLVPSYKRYPKLDFRHVYGMKTGVTLQEFINRILK